LNLKLNGLTTSRGIKATTLIAGILLFMAAGGLYARKLPGVINCTAGCMLDTPKPDPTTRQHLIQEVKKLNDGKATVWTAQTRVRIGDVVTVCNGISCVNYTWQGQEFDSGQEISTVLPPPSRGGGGGSSGGGGSNPIGGGCHGKCGGGRGRTGKVTVGGLNPV